MCYIHMKPDGNRHQARQHVASAISNTSASIFFKCKNHNMFDILGDNLLLLLGLCAVGGASATSSEGVKLHDGMIGFTAWLQNTQMYSEGETILFDGGNINEGDGYIPSMGTFSCLVSAVYFVTVNLKRSSSTYNRVKVVVDGTEILDLYDAEGSYNSHNVVSNSALVQCGQGQSISVVGARSGAVYGEADVQHSTFTVFRMSEGTPLGLHNGTIGFSAYLTGGDVYYEADDIIRFAGIIHNSGAYHPESGKFVCPVSGIYFINTNFQTFYDNPLQLGVSLEDTFMVLHSEEPLIAYNYYNTISNSRFIECSAGQSLAVKGIGVGRVHGDSYYKCSTFSVMYVGEKAGNRNETVFTGFTAFKGSHQSYEPGDLVTFDKILVNEGGHYNGRSFTCPTTAIYFLSVSYKKVYDDPIYLDVVIGSTTLFRSEENHSYNILNTVSNSGLFRCLQGELVKVQGYNSGWLHGDPVKICSTFSIMMMSPL